MRSLPPATVIGASGYVGRALVEALQRRGRTVLAPARGQEAELREAAEVGDLFYCAGLTADYARQPAATAEAHLGLLSRLLEWLRPRRVVYLSSTRLFDSRPGEPVSDSTPLLLDPLNPRHLYDLTKAAGESLCLAMAGERARIARLSCIWSGEDDAPGFLPGLLRQLLALPAYGDGPRRLVIPSHPDLARHYMHRHDLVEALLALAERDAHPPITSLTSEPEAVTNGALAACLERLFAATLRFAPPPSTPVLLPVPPRLDLSHQLQLPITPPPPLIQHLQALFSTRDQS